MPLLFRTINIFSTILAIFIFFINSSSSTIEFNVQQYGAISDGGSDSTSSFLSAWNDACNSIEAPTIYVPPGRYLLGSNVIFEGKSCKNSGISIRIDGTLVAPLDYKVIGSYDSWLEFHEVNGVSIFGGTIDAQGSNLWACKTSKIKDCPQGATSLSFYGSNNIVIDGLTSLNSQMFHILIHSCQTVKLQGLVVSAPGDSPNTDGIHVQSSSDVAILNTQIGTGDDCISIGPGNANLWIENIVCGPGHGISIGSLGWEMDEPGVHDVMVRGVKFTGTQNGVRVKTWARPSNGFVRNIIFQHMEMDNVENPIIIDQNYCPTHKKCPTEGSGVKISDITYQDIHGTSATEVGIKLDCSNTNPCNLIKMEDVNLSFNNQLAKASSANAQVAEAHEADAGTTITPPGYGGGTSTGYGGGAGYGGGTGYGGIVYSGGGMPFSAAAPSDRRRPSVFSILVILNISLLVVL